VREAVACYRCRIGFSTTRRLCGVLFF